MSQRNLPRIKHVKLLGGYRLYLRFTDGREGELDMTDDVRRFTGVLAPLKDKQFFAQVSVDPEWGNLVWPGEIDLDPDVMYSRVTGAPLPGEQTV